MITSSVHALRKRFPVRTFAQNAWKKVFPSKVAPAFPSLIPPRGINYNWEKNADDKDYPLKFDNSRKKYLLFLLSRSSAEIRNGTRLPSILDIGCGFGPLAYAFKAYMESSGVLRRGGGDLSKELLYSGIDIREDAINWLSNAYSSECNFHFHHHEASSNADYVGMYKPLHQNTALTFSESNGSECIYSYAPKSAVDIQWSGSLFTHLTKNAAQECLRYVSKNLCDNGIAVNTWQIVDPSSCLGLYSNVADRLLPIDCGDYLTYSASNPLVCTAYKIDVIEQLYASAGLEITEILLGSWRGFDYDNGLTYQDIIVAKKSKKNRL